jgi:hypothetical protein
MYCALSNRFQHNRRLTAGVDVLTFIGVLLLVTSRQVIDFASAGVTHPVCCTGERFGRQVCTREVSKSCNNGCYFSSKNSGCQVRIESDINGEYTLYKAYAEACCYVQGTEDQASFCLGCQENKDSTCMREYAKVCKVDRYCNGQVEDCYTTAVPTLSPLTSQPSKSPTPEPTDSPTTHPTVAPTSSPLTSWPSKSPTPEPTGKPTPTPTATPSRTPSLPIQPTSETSDISVVSAVIAIPASIVTIVSVVTFPCCTLYLCPLVLSPKTKAAFLGYKSRNIERVKKCVGVMATFLSSACVLLLVYMFPSRVEKLFDDP